MDIEGLVFVGTRTDVREAMAGFVRDVLQLAPLEGHGLDAEMFSLPDGSTFAVTGAEDADDGRRTIGFRVADLDAAAAELRAAGVEVDDEVSEGDLQRYLHFVAPDGRLYELIEDRA